MVRKLRESMAKCWSAETVDRAILGGASSAQSNTHKHITTNATNNTFVELEVNCFIMVGLDLGRHMRANVDTVTGQERGRKAK